MCDQTQSHEKNLTKYNQFAIAHASYVPEDIACNFTFKYIKSKKIGTVSAPGGRV